MSLIIMNIAFSILFVFLNHPLSLGLVILIQTTLISLISGKFCLNFWFSYILFLIMIGGMLILFIYMTSIASNEKFSINFGATILFLMLTLISIISLSIETPFIDQSIKNEMLNSKSINLSFSMIKFTSFPLSLLLMFMIIYLFITLIAIVKIIDNKQGPLRPKN
uniref:NADH dehydrogenase subunit 6 n=1 Tax=Mylabris quadripunctata TaxID=268458 RepID=UPI001FA7ADCF|nr:NADH dehydrogenase subunit 6 [Mylabris quadripunctata]UMR54922.1 NADH dehydrogenase subunit 6 [Mylabris quadripunctata]